MENRVLGRTGMWVSTLGLGTGQFGAFGQLREKDCVRMAHAAFDGGINLVDTADFYSLGEAETITGKAIAGRRDKLLVATKCGMPLSEDPNHAGSSRKWITESVEGSLERLGTDYIDLYQLHRYDPHTSVDETLHALNDLVRAGKIRYFGVSNSPAHFLVEGQLRAELRGLVAPHSEQASYSLLHRSVEADVLPVCHRYGIGFLAYSPLYGGWLSGKYRRGREAERTARQRLQPGRFDLQLDENAPKVEAVEALAGIADAAGVSLSHLATAAVLAHEAVSCALVGGSKLSHVEDYLAGQDVRLSDEVLDAIDAVVAPGSSLEVGPSPVAMDKNLRRRRNYDDGADAAVAVNFIRDLVESERQSREGED